ncbi:MAG: ATP-grasp domain-containing protein [Candidatus Brocadiae bacterium]|nr:ATP-grasp domain-containing protein [Candidatus Brocadiia bacterium]
MKRVLVLYSPYTPGGRKPDIVVLQVARALARLGHIPVPFPVPLEIDALVAGIRKAGPDVIFNLCEEFRGDGKQEARVAAVLELLGIPFTGNGSLGLSLALDKALSKKLYEFHNIAYPEAAVFTSEKPDLVVGHLNFPLFVKPMRSDASLSIGDVSFVKNWDELRTRVRELLRKTRDAVLAEEYVPGREIYAAVLFDRVLPLLEVDFTGLPARKLHIMGRAAKFHRNSAAYRGTRVTAAKKISAGLRRKIEHTAREACRACQVRSYARVDIRVNEFDEPFVIEVNPNPYLEIRSEFARAARMHGLKYVPLVGRLLEEALKRSRTERVF